MVASRPPSQKEPWVPSVSVILPAYNEEASIGATIDRIADAPAAGFGLAR